MTAKRIATFYQRPTDGAWVPFLSFLPGDYPTTPAPSAANASINLPPGTAPTSPNNGDVWTTSTGLYIQIAGGTVGPLAGAPANQNANLVYAGPSSGSAAAPTFRSLVAADLPLATTSAFGAVKPDGTSITIAGGVISSSGGGASGANPTATAGPTAINGSASTFMRSDAAPAIQKASASQFGIVEVDGTTITAAGGVISAVAGGLTVSPLSNSDTPGVSLIGDSLGQAIGVNVGGSSPTRSTTIQTFIARGLSAARPGTPNIASGTSAIWVDTNDGHVFVWTGSTWRTLV